MSVRERASNWATEQVRRQTVCVSYRTIDRGLMWTWKLFGSFQPITPHMFDSPNFKIQKGRAMFNLSLTIIINLQTHLDFPWNIHFFFQKKKQKLKCCKRVSSSACDPPPLVLPLSVRRVYSNVQNILLARTAEAQIASEGPARTGGAGGSWLDPLYPFNWTRGW